MTETQIFMLITLVHAAGFVGGLVLGVIQTRKR